MKTFRVEKLRTLLEDAVERGEEHACQLSVFVEGEPVCDLAAGAASRETWFPLFSAGKGPMITAVLRLIERGVLDCDARIADYWPEFGCCGKEEITLRDVLTHRAGLYSLPGTAFERQAQWDYMCRLLAQRRPVGVPGTRTRYHALTMAWLLGEAARRADGRPFEQIIMEEALLPAGIRDLRYGLAAADEPRVLPVCFPAEAAEDWRVRFIGDPAIRHGFIPSANAFGNAHALAQHYAALISPPCGGRTLLSSGTLRSALVEPVRNPDDPVRGWERFGLGYILCGGTDDPGGVFGHGGALGSEGFAAPRLRLAAAFTTDTLRAGHPVRDLISRELGVPARNW